MTSHLSRLWKTKLRGGFTSAEDARGLIPDLQDTHETETLEHLGGLRRVLECLWRGRTMRQIEIEWHVPLN